MTNHTSTALSRWQADDLDELAIELDQIKADILKKRGEEDANYILNVVRLQRALEIGGRLLLVLFFVHPLCWIVGALFLGVAKILDNMEIGHNILHGQYDWMNHPTLNSQTYEWDNACDAGSWKRTHNYEHHTYTNIIGKDRDFGYGLLRLSDDFRWKPKNRWQFFTYLLHTLLFQWGVAFHEMAGKRVFLKLAGNVNNQPEAVKLRKIFFSKAKRIALKDYLIFPLLAGPMFLPVFLGNLTANVIRNIWTATIIYCGHFTEDVHTFKSSECEFESRGQWYLRQALGSSNFSGPRWLHVMSGHLSFQIEHHLFPDLPSYRYPEISRLIQPVLERHRIPYNAQPFVRQYKTVLERIIRYSRKPEESIIGSA